MHTAGKKVELDIGCEPKCGPADVTAECVSVDVLWGVF